MILADDMGEWAMGCSGNDDVCTPNIGSLAAEGTLFENFFCASPVCSPARASILTGTMPSVHGIHDWLSCGNLPDQRFNGKILPAEQYVAHLTAYTELLAEKGYVCALSGKWHLGDSLHKQKGFGRWFTIGQGGCRYFSPDIVENGKLETRNEFVTDLITENAIKNIRELSAGSDPFYLSVHYTAPHAPWDKCENKPYVWEKYKFKRFSSTPSCRALHPLMIVGGGCADNARQRKKLLRGYYSAITSMDEGIGKIIVSLKECGVYDDTLIIFTSDNGMSMGHNGMFGKGNSTYPQSMHDSAVKVPFIMTGNCLGLRHGERIRGVCSHYDIMPTLIDLLDLDSEKVRQHLPGKSFAPLLRGLTDPSDFGSGVVAVSEYGMSKMLRNERYKLVLRSESFDEFYDLKSDPEEKNNLAGDPETALTAEMMKAQLERFLSENTDPRYSCDGLTVSGHGQVADIVKDRYGCFDEWYRYRRPYAAKIFLKRRKKKKIK